MTLHISLYDDEDGTEDKVELPDNDYVIFTTGRCKVASVNRIQYESLLPDEPSPLPYALVADPEIVVISGRTGQAAEEREGSNGAEEKPI